MRLLCLGTFGFFRLWKFHYHEISRGFAIVDREDLLDAILIARRTLCQFPKTVATAGRSQILFVGALGGIRYLRCHQIVLKASLPAFASAQLSQH